VQLEGLRNLKKNNGFIGTRTGDFLVCSEVTQLTLLRRGYNLVCPQKFYSSSEGGTGSLHCRFCGRPPNLGAVPHFFPQPPQFFAIILLFNKETEEIRERTKASKKDEKEKVRRSTMVQNGCIDIILLCS
jgi:hypothetical protein